MAKAYFISDAHLGLGNPEEEKMKEKYLSSFLAKITNDADYLFILGDLFDAWFEYKTVIPRGFHNILSALDNVVKQKVKVHYLAGNHDYWMNNFFSDELGIITHPDNLEISIDEKNIYMHHGDGFSINDRGYKFLKGILRNPINIRLYKLLHPDIGVKLAKNISKLSRKHSSVKNYSETDGMKQEAEKKFLEGYDIVIMGHRHEPVLDKSSKGIYINLGDWIKHFTYAELSDGEISLKKWNPE